MKSIAALHRSPHAARMLFLPLLLSAGMAQADPAPSWNAATLTSALGVLAQAPDHGLPASRYGLAELKRMAAAAPPGQRAGLQRALTAALVDFGADLRPRESAPTATDIERAAAAGDLRGYYRARVSQHPDYAPLQAALVRYRRLEQAGGWPLIPAGPTLAPGSTGARVALLRQRLRVTGDIATDAPTGDFDAVLEAAVEQFQNRHGLDADGRVGPRTLAALNETAATKVSRLATNLHRVRELPRVPAASRVEVNIPEYRLRMYQGERAPLEMRVVVGKPSSPTPVFTDQIEHVVFNPYWYLPRSIATRDMLPRLQRDPGYLQRARLDVFDRATGAAVDGSTINWNEWDAATLPYRFRQQPGRYNAMGQLKFIFPNDYAVYLHDTPSRKLFGKVQRAYSAGCVRLEDPAALARAVLAAEAGWTDAAVAAALDSDKPRKAELAQTLAVHLVYLTTTHRNGVVKFLPDVYDHDRNPPAPLDTRYAPRIAAALADQADPSQLASR